MILVSGCIRTVSTTCCQSSTALPSSASKRSPVFSPAAWAGPFGSSSARTGGNAGRHGRIPNERIGSGSSAPLSHSLSTSSRGVSAVEPCSRTRTCSEPLSPSRRTSCRLTALQPVVASPSMATISWPGVKPALAAMLPDSMAPMTGRTCSLPSIANTQKKNRASKKLAIGPAATMAIRCRTDLRLKDWSS